MKIDLKALKKEILSLATEDYFGLYEIVWGLNREFPELSEGEKISNSKKAVAELLQDELIQLYKIDDPKRKYVLIPNARAHSLISKVESWRPEKSYIGFAATPKGDKAYSKNSKSA